MADPRGTSGEIRDAMMAGHGYRSSEGEGSAPSSTLPDTVVSAPRPLRRRRAAGGISEADRLNEREMTRILNDRSLERARAGEGMKKGGVVKMASGGKVRGDGICSKGKTKGRFC